MHVINIIAVLCSLNSQWKSSIVWVTQPQLASLGMYCSSYIMWGSAPTMLAFLLVLVYSNKMGHLLHSHFHWLAINYFTIHIPTCIRGVTFYMTTWCHHNYNLSHTSFFSEQKVIEFMPTYLSKCIWSYFSQHNYCKHVFVPNDVVCVGNSSSGT